MFTLLMAMMMMMVVVVVTPFSSAAQLTPVDTKEIVAALIAHPPTRFPLLFAVLPNNELVVIISGPDSSPNNYRLIEGAVIFRQPLASMTTGGPVLQEGAGRLLAELYPDLAGYYNRFEGKSGLGAVCFDDHQDHQDQDHPMQCLLFMQYAHVENESGGSVVTFDLLVPFDGTATSKGCIREGEFWPRTANPILPLPVDRLNQYFSYRARSKDYSHQDEEAFYLNSSLAKTLVAALPKKDCLDSAAPLNVAQGPTVNKSLCNVQGKNQFTLQEEGCGGLAFDKKFTAGFVVADEGGGDLLKGVFLLPTFDSFQVMILPAEVIADLDQALKVGVCDGPKWVNRDDFWKKWNSFKADSCQTEPVPTTAAPPTTTAKSTTTTTTSTTTSSTSTTTTKKTTGKVVPDGKGSTTTATSSSPGNATTTPNNVTASVNGSTSHSEVDSTTGKAMLYIIIGVFVLVVVLVLILITVICIWSKRGKSGQEKGGKGAKEDKSVSRATSSAASSKVPSKVAASKVPSKVGGKAAPSKMKAKESATKQSKQQPLKAAPSKAAAAGGGKAPVKAGPKGAKGKGTSNALGSSFQTSAVA